MTFTSNEIHNILINANLPDNIYITLSNSFIDLMLKKKAKQERIKNKKLKEIKATKRSYYKKNKQKYKDYYKKNRILLLEKQKIIDKNRR